jgi:hypothetical protein
MKIKMILTLLLSVGIIIVCGQKPANSWEKWEFLLGEWAGEGHGLPGQGIGAFSFTPELDGNILVRRSHVEFPSTETRSAFNHDDLLIVYKNNSGIPSYAIYFDNENHSINYNVTYIESSIVLISEKNPGIPRFRLTYTKLDNKKLNVRFEMTSPQNPEEFKTYLEGQSVRK